MRRVLFVLGLAACSAPDATIDVDAGLPDAATEVDAASGVPLAGFGDLAGMCGVLANMNLTGDAPELVRGTFSFMRRYIDPADRSLLTEGGQRLAETPNAGGSSGLSEVFAYEQLARCELATLLKTETEVVYNQTGKITDLLVTIDGHKIGVSVTRAMTYPYGMPYTLETATTLMSRKLSDIQMSTANVSEQDRWEKQILAFLAWDDQAADVLAQAWAGLDATIKSDTIVVVTSTGGEDIFIYSNM